MEAEVFHRGFSIKMSDLIEGRNYRGILLVARRQGPIRSDEPRATGIGAQSGSNPYPEHDKA